jgi:hypothetical protein
VARNRTPKPEIATTLAAVSHALQAVRAAEAELDQTRNALQTALHAAHQAGASYSLLGQLTGLSRQRVGQLINRR